MDEIRDFTQQYSFLRNSAEKLSDDGKPIQFIVYEDIAYTNVTSAYLANQIADKGLRYAFAKLSASEAFAKFREWKKNVPDFLDTTFEERSRSVLHDLLTIKFSDKEFADSLRETDGLEIVYENTYGDKFLGVCDGEGENYLGISLMEIREKLVKEQLIYDNYVFSIGYGNLSIRDFLDKLQQFGIKVIIDIRRFPISHNASFSQELLKTSLYQSGIEYRYLGVSFGEVDRDNENSFDNNGHVLYNELWNKEKNDKLLAVLTNAIDNKVKICFLSGEFDPTSGHRAGLIGKKALEMGVDICHILNPYGISFQSDIQFELEDISPKTYWGFSPEAASMMKKIEDFSVQYNSGLLFGKLSKMHSKDKMQDIVEIIENL